MQSAPNTPIKSFRLGLVQGSKPGLGVHLEYGVATQPLLCQPAGAKIPKTSEGDETRDQSLFGQPPLALESCSWLILKAIRVTLRCTSQYLLYSK